MQIEKRDLKHKVVNMYNMFKFGHTDRQNTLFLSVLPTKVSSRIDKQYHYISL